MNEHNHESIPPPLPSPTGDVCSQCSARVDVNAEFCAHCGAKLYKAPSGGSGFWSEFVHAMVGLGLILLTLTFALGGSCALLIVMFGGAGELGSLVFICGLAAVGFGGAWLCWKAYRKRSKSNP